MEGSKKEVMKDTEEDNAYVKRMLNLISPSVYFNPQDKRKIGSLLAANTDERSQLSTKALNKRQRLDPSSYLTTTDLQEVINDRDDDDEDDDDDDDDEGSASEEEEGQPKSKRKRTLKPPKLNSSAESRAANAEQLQERLRKKIEELKAQRGSDQARDSIEKKRLRRKEMKAKQRDKQKHDNQSALSTPSSSKPSPTSDLPPPKPIFNANGKLVFSKFDFAAGAGKEDKKKKKEATGKRKYEKLLQQVQAKKEKMKELKQKDQEKAKEVEEKDRWQAALKRASGEKVKDDAGLLKKAIKRKENQKKKSDKSWQERQEQVKYVQKKSQDKRTRNIKARKQQKISTKIQKQKKKGRVIPGF